MIGWRKISSRYSYRVEIFLVKQLQISPTLVTHRWLAIFYLINSDWWRERINLVSSILFCSQTDLCNAIFFLSLLVTNISYQIYLNNLLQLIINNMSLILIQFLVHVFNLHNIICFCRFGTLICICVGNICIAGTQRIPSHSLTLNTVEILVPCETESVQSIAQLYTYIICEYSRF
jgi:hypothetical protein